MTPDEPIKARTTPPSSLPADNAFKSVLGHFVYEAHLTPGSKKGGGLHGNLYDSDRKLAGGAGFFPLDDAPPQVASHDRLGVYDEEYERHRAREQAERDRVREENNELIVKVILHVAIAAKPHVERLWREKALPAIEARRIKKTERKALKAAAAQPVIVEATIVDSGQELAVVEDEYRTNMSSAEAQARYIAALAARAFSDDQMERVSNANIVDEESLAERQNTPAELPQQKIKAIIEAVKTNPSALSGDGLAELRKLLGLDRIDSETIPIEERKAPEIS